MIRGQLLLVLIFTMGGLALTIATAEVAVEYGGSVTLKLGLFILAAIGALIATVGLSAIAIVSAIRHQPHDARSDAVKSG